MITKVIKFDINKKMFETITAKQGDTKSRFILFNLYDGPIQFDLTGRTVRVYGKKKDNTTIFNDLVITDAKKGYCTLELTNQMLAVEGMNELELVIFEGEKRLSTMPFILNVIGSKYSEDAIVSTNEFTALMNALKTVSNIDNKAEKKDVEELSSQLDNKASEVALVVERKRIDNLAKLDEGSTTGDAELIDLRVAGNGKTYKNAGESVRSQYTESIMYSKTIDGERMNDNSVSIVYGENAYDDAGRLVISSQWNRARSELFKPKFNTVAITPTTGYLIGYTIVDDANNTVTDVGFKDTEQVINISNNNNLIIRCKKSDDDRPDSSIKLFNIYYVGKINTRVAELERKQQNSITINLSYYYEKGLIGYQTGVIGDYSTGFKHSRTGKFLKVVGGSPIKAIYTIVDKLYLYEYDKNKKFIMARSLATNSERNLNKETVFVKFQHDNYTNGDVLLTYHSPEIHTVWEYNNRPSGDTIAFGYEVCPSYKTDVDDTVTTLDTKKAYTSGLLMLPPNYSEHGEKVPVIYFSHGSGDYQSILNKEFSQYYMEYIRYLADEGFAIFDCYGWTDMYVTSGCQMANPTNMAAIKQGLKWVCDNYNVDINHVYVTGKSLGGLQAINMCYERDFPIKACCPIAPEIDATSIGFGYEKDGRKSYARDLGFSEDVNGVLEEEGAKVLHDFSSNFKAYAKKNAFKLQGYNPLWRNLLNADIEELIQYQIDADHLIGLPNKIKTMLRICEVPTKIIVAKDDRAVSHDLCSAYLQSIKNTGGVAELRSLPANTGGHHAVDNDPNALKVESITTKCGITHTNVPLAYAEMVQFFRRYM